MSIRFEYFVTTLGLSQFDNLESFGARLQQLLDTEAAAYEESGWELWQVNALNDSINGLILVFRRAK
ncbi:MAG: hypothetical protein H7Z41_16975 [Cytophagales bacterium]|nr:hypothetical protein [Armatimonadota bacterium]